MIYPWSQSYTNQVKYEIMPSSPSIFDLSHQLLLKKTMPKRIRTVRSPIRVDLQAHMHQLPQAVACQNLIACLQAIYILPVL